jgi:hypothetical protein
MIQLLYGVGPRISSPARAQPIASATRSTRVPTSAHTESRAVEWRQRRQAQWLVHCAGVQCKSHSGREGGSRGHRASTAPNRPRISSSLAGGTCATPHSSTTTQRAGPSALRGATQRTKPKLGPMSLSRNSLQPPTVTSGTNRRTVCARTQPRSSTGKCHSRASTSARRPAAKTSGTQRAADADGRWGASGAPAAVACSRS